MTNISEVEQQRRADQRRRTMPLWPDAGQQLGLSRNGTYAAAARGEVPGAMRLGRKWVVVIERFERMLAGE